VLVLSWHTWHDDVIIISSHLVHRCLIILHPFYILGKDTRLFVGVILLDTQVLGKKEEL